MEKKILEQSEYMKCVLTEEELKTAGADLARKHSEVIDLENQKKSVVSDFGARIAQVKESSSVLARMIQNGYEYRNVDCQMEFDYDEKIVSYRRLDTDEIYKERVMSADELQRGLFEKEDREETAEDEEPTDDQEPEIENDEIVDAEGYEEEPEE